MPTLNRFEEIMRKDNWPGDNTARLAVIHVADTMFAFREWCEVQGVSYTAADLLAMTCLTFEREREVPAPGYAMKRWTQGTRGDR